MKKYSQECINNYYLSIPSYHDLTSENSYHMFFVGLCTWFTKEYEIISNTKKKGREDVILS